MLDKVVYYAEVIMWVIIALSIVIGLVLFIFSKKRRVGLETDRDEKWEGLKRVDSKSYVPAEDVLDDMLVFDNGTRFVMAIACRGNSFYDYALEEQLAIANGYEGFINTINKPIVKRIVSRPMNLDDMIKYHKSALEKKTELLRDLYENLSALYKERNEESNEERKSLYNDEIARVEKLVEVNEWKQKHLEHELMYLAMFDGIEAQPIPEDYYLVNWTFNAMEFPVEITKDEIRQRAHAELDALVGQKISALSYARVPARRVTGEELEELVKRHYRPVTTDLFRSSDDEKTNVDGSIADAEKSLAALREKVIKERLENGHGEKTAVRNDGSTEE